MTTDEQVRHTVRNMRLDLGDTQTEFAARLGCTLCTVQRYENLVPPKGAMLKRLETLAKKDSRLEYAARCFRNAVNRETPNVKASATPQEWTTEELTLP